MSAIRLCYPYPLHHVLKAEEAMLKWGAEVESHCSPGHDHFFADWPLEKAFIPAWIENNELVGP